MALDLSKKAGSGPGQGRLQSRAVRSLAPSPVGELRLPRFPHGCNWTLYTEVAMPNPRELSRLATCATDRKLLRPEEAQACMKRVERRRMEGEALPDKTEFLQGFLGLDEAQAAEVQQAAQSPVLMPPIPAPTPQLLNRRETIHITVIVAVCAIGCWASMSFSSLDSNYVLTVWGAILAGLIPLERAFRRHQFLSMALRWVRHRRPRLFRFGYVALRRSLILAGLSCGVALIIRLHSTTGIAHETVVCAYVAVILAACASALYELKHRALMFAEARSGAMKDMHSTIDRIRRDPGITDEEKRQRIIVACIRTLRSIVRLNEWCWMKTEAQPATPTLGQRELPGGRRKHV